MTAADDLVADVARTADRDRYLSALYAPESKRTALFALYAFDAEAAAIRDKVREAMAGEIRLQWWRDALPAAALGTQSGHPIADALGRAIREHGLPLKAFDDYLDARLFDLYEDPMLDRTDLEGYCGETSGAIIQLAAVILDREAAPAVASSAGHAGCAQGIVQILGRLPAQKARGQCYLPAELLSASGTSYEAFLAAKPGDATAEHAVAAMTALAHEHLEAFHAAGRAIPKTLRPAFLPLAIAATQLSAMRSPAEVLAGQTEISAWRKQLALGRAAVFGL